MPTAEEGRAFNLCLDLALDYERGQRAEKARQKRIQKRRAQTHIVPALMMALTAAQIKFERATGYQHGRPGYVLSWLIPVQCHPEWQVPANLIWQTPDQAASKQRHDAYACPVNCVGEQLYMGAKEID
jgi:hypothetical protein